MDEQNKKRLTWIDNAKGFAIILVVLGHVISNLDSSGFLTNDVWLSVKRWMYEFHMPLFFFLSGLLINKYLGNSAQILTNFFKRRSISLIIPYVSFSILYLLMKCVFSGTGAVINKVSIYDALYLYKNPIGEYWFLYALILFNLIFVAISYMQKKHATMAIVIIALAFFFVDVLDLNDFEWVGVKRAIPFALFFFLGTILYKYIHFCNQKRYIAIFLPVIICAEIFDTNAVIFSRFQSMLYVLFFCCVFNSINFNFFEYLGRNSLVIYLFHPFFIVLFKMFACKIHLESFVVICVTIAAIVFSLLTYEYIVKRVKPLLLLVSPLKVITKV